MLQEQRENWRDALQYLCSDLLRGLLALRVSLVAQKACGQKLTFIKPGATLAGIHRVTCFPRFTFICQHSSHQTSEWNAFLALVMPLRILSWGVIRVVPAVHPSCKYL